MTVAQSHRFFHGSHTSFSSDISENFGAIPYQEIAPGFLIGFEDDCGVDINISLPQSRDLLFIEIDDLGATRWLTLEFSISSSQVKDFQNIFWSAVMSSSSNACLRMELRCWRGSNFDDFFINQFSLSERMMRISQNIEIQNLPIDISLDSYNGMSLILILPLIKNAYRLNSIIRFPVNETMID